MRNRWKFLLLSGLCGVAMTCLIGLADDGPNSNPSEEFVPIPASIAGGQTEPEPTERYTRDREPKRPSAIQFNGDFLAKQPGEKKTPKLEVGPVGGAKLPAQMEPVDHLVNAKYKDPSKEKSAPAATLPLEKPEAEEKPVPTLFGDNPSPKGNVTVYPADLPALAPEKKAEKRATTPTTARTPAATPTPAPVKPSAAPASLPVVVPASGPQTTEVTLEWVRRTEINVGQECQCDLVVKNSGAASAQNVIVKTVFPPSARLLPTTKPAPTPAGNQLEWNLGELAGNQSKTIEVHMIPTTRDNLTASAFVHFTTAAATVFPVQEPLLKVVLKGPNEVQVGDPASQIIQVSNPGTGTAKNVQIKALIPTGLEHSQGRQLSMSIGSLNPGETRMIRLALSAVSGGDHEIKVLAEAKLAPEDAPYLRHLTDTKVRVISPSVKVVAEGPGLRYKNRNATYNITVANDGTAVSNNVRVMHKVPDGFKFVSATAGGKYDALSKSVAWFVGRIAPGDASEMAVTLEATKLGEFVHQISAITDQGARSEDEISTQVDGIASLALEVKDVNDPVEVGVETAYEIHVKNQGTKHAQNVSVACELPEGVELVNVEAPARHNLQGEVVVFQALPALAADKTAVYRVIVRGKSDGYQRFRVRLSSDSIKEPLLVEELTKFYGE